MDSSRCQRKSAFSWWLRNDQARKRKGTRFAAGRPSRLPLSSLSRLVESLSVIFLVQAPRIMYPRRKADVKTSVLPDGHVVLFSDTRDWGHTLNPRAALIWEFCDGEHTVAEIVSEVA